VRKRLGEETRCRGPLCRYAVELAAEWRDKCDKLKPDGIDEVSTLQAELREANKREPSSCSREFDRLMKDGCEREHCAEQAQKWSRAAARATPDRCASPCSSVPWSGPWEPTRRRISTLAAVPAWPRRSRSRQVHRRSSLSRSLARGRGVPRPLLDGGFEAGRGHRPRVLAVASGSARAEALEISDERRSCPRPTCHSGSATAAGPSSKSAIVA